MPTEPPDEIGPLGGGVRPSGISGGLPPDPFGPQTGSGFEVSGEIRPLTALDRDESDDFGFGDTGDPGELRVPVPFRPDNAGPSWMSGSGRFSDLLSQVPSTGEPALADQPGSLRPGSLEAARSDPMPAGAVRPPTDRPDTLGSADERRTREARPSSAPPYPYEGDLEDDRRNVSRPATGPHRGSVPLSRIFPAVRPAAPGGRRADWIGAESARHAVEPAALPDSPAPADKEPLTGETSGARAAYDPATFPRRLPYEPTSPAGAEPGPPPPPAHPEALPGEPVSGALPQRVPAEPDVPTVPEPPPEPAAETPALARIATHLRRDDLPPVGERQDGFDVQAIIAAVQEVAGVRDALLRTTPQGAHSLRLDLAEGADPAEVSRQVARLLQDRMGLDAAMKETPASAAPPPPVSGTAPVPFVPTQPVPTGRASVVPPARSPLPEFTDLRSAAASPPAAEAATAAGPADPAGPSTTAGTTDGALSDLDRGPARPLSVGERPGPRVVIENVQVNTFGTEATVEVRLAVGGQVAAGTATGPAFDGYLHRLCATATAHAVDELLTGTEHTAGPARCFVEHAASVPFGPLQVAVVVLLLSCGTWVEQLAGSAVVTGDDRNAVVRATLAAVNRRLEALLSR